MFWARVEAAIRAMKANPKMMQMKVEYDGRRAIVSRVGGDTFNVRVMEGNGH